MRQSFQERTKWWAKFRLNTILPKAHDSLFCLSRAFGKIPTEQFFFHSMNRTTYRTSFQDLLICFEYVEVAVRIRRESGGLDFCPSQTKSVKRDVPESVDDDTVPLRPQDHQHVLRILLPAGQISIESEMIFCQISQEILSLYIFGLTPQMGKSIQSV